MVFKSHADMLPEPDPDDNCVARMSYLSFLECKEDFSPWRRRAGELLTSVRTEFVLGVVITLNFIVVIIETDMSVKQSARPLWLSTAGRFFQIFYVLELLLRIYVYRKHFWHDRYRVLDITVVLTDAIVEIIDLVMGAMENVTAIPLLRILRLARLAKAMKVLVMFPELHMMIQSIQSAIVTIMWGSLLMSITIVSWAIVAVQVLHPVNQVLTKTGYYEREGCTRCPHAYKSVWEASITIIQHFLTGDSWGQISIPIINHSPATLLLFMAMLATIVVLLLNLVLTVMIESATEAREKSIMLLGELRNREDASNLARMRTRFRTTDKDGNGFVTLNELEACFDNNDEVAGPLKALGLCKDDLAVFLELMSAKGDGTVTYDSFVENLYRMRTIDPLQCTIMITKHLNVMLDILASGTPKNCDQHNDSNVRSSGDDGGTLTADSRSEIGSICRLQRWLHALDESIGSQMMERTQVMNSLESSIRSLVDSCSLDAAQVGQAAGCVIGAEECACYSQILQVPSETEATLLLPSEECDADSEVVSLAQDMARHTEVHPRIIDRSKPPNICKLTTF